MLVKRFSATVPETSSRGRAQPVWRVGSVLKAVMGLSRPERARIWREGGVTVNGAPVSAQHIHCRPSDIVEAWYPERASSVQPQPDLPLRILYEDSWLLAVDKPAGQLSHPARSEQWGTVANAVAAHNQTPSLDQHVEPVRLVHRLDRDTSGVLLFVRSAAAARSLARQRASGTLVRDYLAVVSGRPPPIGEIDFALGPDPTHRTRRVTYPAIAVQTPVDPSQPRAIVAARTTYRVIQYGPHAALVAAQLHSGRTHQLRAHFAGSGHPLLGDDLYGGPPSSAIAGQTLHAWRTRLCHPTTGVPLTLVAPLPPDFRAAAWEALRLR